MIIKKTFEEYLQALNGGLRIEEHPSNPDIDVLYHKKERLCSIPKGLKKSTTWHNIINDKRSDAGYTTSDGIQHRSLSGVGLVLLGKKLITPKEFVDNFITERNKELLEKMSMKKAGLIV
jgi:hypothetical protein